MCFFSSFAFNVRLYHTAKEQQSFGERVLFGVASLPCTLLLHSVLLMVEQRTFTLASVIVSLLMDYRLKKDAVINTYFELVRNLCSIPSHLRRLDAH